MVNDRFPRNRDVTVLEMAPEILLQESGAGRSHLVLRMMEKGINIQANAKVTKVDETNIYYEQNGVEYCISDADTLVFANGYHVDPTMEEMLKEANVTYHMIGDASKPGNIKDAITQAWDLAKDL